MRFNHKVQQSFLIDRQQNMQITSQTELVQNVSVTPDIPNLRDDIAVLQKKNMRSPITVLNAHKRLPGSIPRDMSLKTQAYHLSVALN